MVIVDGHNLLHTVCKLEEYKSVGDVQLCRIVGRYLKQVGEKGEIVFDGTGPRDKSGFDNVTNLEVTFAGQGADADTVIEGRIKASTGPRRLTGVSTDRRLRVAAQKRRATIVKSHVFWSDVQKQLRQKKKTIKEPIEKVIGLSEGEAEQWLKLFHIEQ